MFIPLRFRFLLLVTPLLVAPLLACEGEHHGCSDEQPLGLSTSTLSVPLEDGGAPDAADDAADAADHVGDPAYDIGAACQAAKCVAPDQCVVQSNGPGAVHVNCVSRGPEVTVS